MQFAKQMNCFEVLTCTIACSLECFQGPNFGARPSAIFVPLMCNQLFCSRCSIEALGKTHVHSTPSQNFYLVYFNVSFKTYGDNGNNALMSHAHQGTQYRSLLSLSVLISEVLINNNNNNNNDNNNNNNDGIYDPLNLVNRTILSDVCLQQRVVH